MVPRRAPGQRRLRRARPRRRRLRIRLGGGEVRGLSGTVGGGVVVSERSRGRLAGHAAAAATVREREAVRAESLVPATTQISDLTGTRDLLQNASIESAALEWLVKWNKEAHGSIDRNKIKTKMTAEFDNH